MPRYTTSTRTVRPPTSSLYHLNSHSRTLSLPILTACEDGDEALVQAASLNLAGGHGQWISNVHIEPFDQEAAFHAKLYPRYRDGLLGAARQFCAETAKGDDDDADRTLVILSAGE